MSAIGDSILDAVLANLPGVAFRCANNPSWDMLYISEGLRDLAGYDVADVLGSARVSYADLMHPEDRDRVWDEIQAALARRETYQVEYRVVRADGGIVWVWEQGRGVFDGQGQILFLDGVIIDVTARARAEQELRVSHEKFRRLFELEADAVILVDSGSGRVLEANERAAQLYGYTHEELLALRIVDLSLEAEETERAIQEELPHVPLRRHVKKDGAALPVEIMSSHFELGGSRLHLAAIRDISQRLQEEEELDRSREQLRASEERFRTLVEEAPIAIMVQTGGYFRYANRAAGRLFGETPSAPLVGRQVLELTHPDYHQTMVERMQTVRSQRVVPAIRSAVLTPDRQRIEVESSAVPFIFEGEEGSLVFMTDVTERLKTEEALRLTQHSIDNVTDAIFWSDSDARITYASQSLCRSLGWQCDELLDGKTIFDLDPTLTLARWKEIWTEMQNKGIVVFETVHRTQAGQVFPVEVAANLVRFGDRDYNCAVARDISERKKAQDEAARLNEIVEQVQSEIYVFDAETLRFVEANGTARRNLGYSMKELLRMTPLDLKPSYTSASFEKLVAPLRGGRVRQVRFTTEHRRKDGSLYPIEAQVRLHTGGERPLFVAAMLDITDRVQAEKEIKLRDEQLQQGQKMEAIGRLAGGVAHDFNNILTAVLGYSDLLLAGDLSDPKEIRGDLTEVRLAALRAKELTSQILAFSRRQPHQPRVVRANDLILETEPLLRRTLGEDIELACRLGRDAGSIEVDPGQFNQVLLNLAVNARDAMPGGGRLAVETDTITFEHAAWLRLAIADTGHGMDSETLERLFEPFFTTKRPGEGTGLGLSTVYGIIAQSGGRISVESERGVGTLFTVLLPSVAPADEAPPPGAEPATPRPVPGANGRRATILVVEDEPAVRRLAARVLREQGYEVLTAADGSQAVALAGDAEVTIDMLLTDVVLPGELQGDEVARLVLAERPRIGCLFMSGYPREVIAKAGRLAEGVNYLEKPFTAATLVRRVGEVLNAGS